MKSPLHIGSSHGLKVAWSGSSFILSYEISSVYSPSYRFIITEHYMGVYGQFSIETIHDRRKRNREFVLLIRIGKQNVKIIEK